MTFTNRIVLGPGVVAMPQVDVIDGKITAYTLIVREEDA